MESFKKHWETKQNQQSGGYERDTLNCRRDWAGAGTLCVNLTRVNWARSSHTLPSAARAVYCDALQLCPVPVIASLSAPLYAALSHRSL